MQGSSRPDREFLDAAALCNHLVGEDFVHAFLAEHHPRLIPDEMFADQSERSSSNEVRLIGSLLWPAVQGAKGVT